MYQALRKSAEKRLAEIGTAQVVVGIPSCNDQTTIANVVRIVSEGLRIHFSAHRCVLVLADGGSTDDTREVVENIPLKGIEKIVTIYRGIPGKGSAIRAILEVVVNLGAGTAIMVDADLRSVSPSWIKMLGELVHLEKCDFVTPLYLRHKFDGTITNDIAYPLTRALYGVRIRQPIGGDFALCGQLAQELLEEKVWESDVARFGIDIFMTTTALARGYRTGEAALGVKIHDPKDPIHLTPMFRQVVGTMFELAGKYYPHWKEIKGSVLPRHPGEMRFAEPTEVKISLENLKVGFKAGWERFYPLWKDILKKNNLEELKKIRSKDAHLPAESWARIVYDYLVAYQIKRKIDRFFFIWSLVPLYQLRTASFVEEAQDMTNQEAEILIENQARIFEELKPYLLKSWSQKVVTGKNGSLF